MSWLQLDQGSEEWLMARRGKITGSRFKDARDKLKGGQPSKACLGYAMDVARERVGGSAPSKFQNAAMRTGNEQEPFARAMYEACTGHMVDEAGFYLSDDAVFGLSPDGLIDDDGVLEIKTMVSSDTLFTSVADGDVSAYMDQCLGYLWLLGRQWVDLVLWTPDLNHMVIKRITRDEDAIEALEADLMAFARLVHQYEITLRAALESSNQLAGVTETITSRQESEQTSLDAHRELLAQQAQQAQADIAQAAQTGALHPATAGDLANLASEQHASGLAQQAIQQAATLSSMPAPAKAASAPSDDGARINLSAINEHLQKLKVDAAQLAALGFEPVATVKASKLYRASDLPAIRAALIAHLTSLAELETV